MSNDLNTHSTAATASSAPAETLNLDRLLSVVRDFRERYPEPPQLDPIGARRLLVALGRHTTALRIGAIYLRTEAGDVCVYPGDPFPDALLPLQGGLAALPVERITFSDLSVLSHP